MIKYTKRVIISKYLVGGVSQSLRTVARAYPHSRPLLYLVPSHSQQRVGWGGGGGGGGGDEQYGALYTSVSYQGWWRVSAFRVLP